MSYNDIDLSSEIWYTEIREKTNDNLTVYIYDASGLPIGMQYHGANYAAVT